MDRLVPLIHQLDGGRNSPERSQARSQIRRFAGESLANLVLVVETLFTFLEGKNGTLEKTRKVFVELSTQFLRQAPELVQRRFIQETIDHLAWGSERFSYTLFDSLISSGLAVELDGSTAALWRKYFSQQRGVTARVGLVSDQHTTTITRLPVRGRIFRLVDRLTRNDPTDVVGTVPTPEQIRHMREIPFGYLPPQLMSRERQGEPEFPTQDQYLNWVSAPRTVLLERVANESKYSVTTRKRYRSRFSEEMLGFAAEHFSNEELPSAVREAISYAGRETRERLALHFWFEPLSSIPFLQRRHPRGIVITAEWQGSFGPVWLFANNNLSWLWPENAAQEFEADMFVTWEVLALRALADVVCTQPLSEDLEVDPAPPTYTPPQGGEPRGRRERDPFQTFLRLVPRSSGHGDHGSDGVERRSVREHPVEAHPRTLPQGKRPSAVAIALAASQVPPIHLQPGQTCVRAHRRGWRKNLSTSTELVEKP